MSVEQVGRPYRSPQGRALVAMVMLGLSGIFNLSDAAAKLWMLSLLSDAANRDGLQLGTAEQIDSVNLAMLVTRIGLMVVTAAAFLTWLHRAVANAIALGYAMPCSPAGAVGSWFVPCYNLAWGWKIGQELWRASMRTSLDEPGGGSSGVVAGWWLTYVGSAVVSRIGGSIGGFGATLASFTGQVQADLASALLLVISAVLGVIMIREITRAQQRLFAASTDAAMAPPTTF